MLLAFVSARGVQGRGPDPEEQGARFFEGRYVFTTYGREDGLGDLNVHELLQDRTGFLWAGTENGLYRFDARQFVKMGTELAALDTRINVLHETPDGTLLAGTRAGLARREGDRFVAVGAESGLPNAEVLDGGIASDEKGHIWVGTPEGLFRSENGTFRLVPRPGGLPEVRITALHREPSGRLWVARGTSLTETDANGMRDAGAGIELPAGEQIERILADGAGSVWLRTLRTLWVREKGSDRFVRDDAGLPASSEFGRLELGEKGELLVPTVRGLARRAGGSWSLIGRPEGLPGTSVNCAIVDREGSLWIGLAGEGVARRLGRGAFSGGGEEKGLAHNLVWAIARETSRGGSGPLWVGTEEGLNRIDPADGAIRTFRRKDGLASDVVQTLAALPDGRVYAGHWPGGITRLGPGDAGPRRCELEGTDSSAVKVASLYLSKGGDLYAGTDAGVFRLPAGALADRFVAVPVPGGAPAWRMFGFVETADGLLWGAGEGGLVRLTGPDPRRFGPQEGLRTRDLSCIAVLSDGSFAVGHRYAPGVDRLVVRGGRVSGTPFPLPPGAPPGQKAVFLGRDAGGALWAGTQDGIDVFPERGEPVHYGRSDGLLTDDMDQNAFFAEPDGTVWAGTSRGLVRYLPGVPPPPRLPPPVVLLEAWAGDRRLDPSQAARLARSERDVRLSWTALTFVEPRRVRYRYRLSGVDASPVETSLGEVRFTALPSGSYRFEVSAVSAAGVPSAAPAVFAFSVSSAWWEQAWAWLLGGLLVGGAVVSIIRWRTRTLEDERRRLEAAVLARSTELAAMNRELQEASLTDPLTGLRNRRFFSAEIGRDVAQVLRAFKPQAAEEPPEGRDLIFYLVDLDHFKEINDLHGHDAGDRVLVEIAGRLESVMRKSDSLIRWGGEEFLVLSRGGDRQQARILAERILSVISREPVDLGKARSVWKTCSIGWAPYPWLPAAPDAVSYEEVLRLADRALLLAKRSGRHQAVGLLPPEGEPLDVERTQSMLRQLAPGEEEQALAVIFSPGPVTPE